MFRLTLLVLLALGMFVGLRILLAKRSISVRQFFLIYLAAIVGSLLVYLGITGRLHWLFALIGAALPALGWISRVALGLFMQGVLRPPFPGRQQSRGPTPSSDAGQTSDFSTPWVRVVLDHDTGDIDGEVLQGSFSGARLSQLNLGDVVTVLHSAAADADTVQVLEAYLDRMHEGWRDHAGGGQSNGQGSGRTDRPASGGPMTRAEALDVLGLDDTASEEDIVEAHKRLIQKLHPDRGGSTFLATKINQAKDLLLKR